MNNKSSGGQICKNNVINPRLRSIQNETLTDKHCLSSEQVSISLAFEELLSYVTFIVKESNSKNSSITLFGQTVTEDFGLIYTWYKARYSRPECTWKSVHIHKHLSSYTLRDPTLTSDNKEQMDNGLNMTKSIRNPLKISGQIDGMFLSW